MLSKLLYRLLFALSTQVQSAISEAAFRVLGTRTTARLIQQLMICDIATWYFDDAFVLPVLFTDKIFIKCNSNSAVYKYKARLNQPCLLTKNSLYKNDSVAVLKRCRCGILDGSYRGRSNDNTNVDYNPREPEDAYETRRILHGSTNEIESWTGEAENWMKLIY